MVNSDARWIWYPGDMELYYALKQNFSRGERGYGWPAFWKSEGYRQRVTFRRTYHLDSLSSFTVYGSPGAVGYVQVNGEKHPFAALIPCEAGDVSVSIHIGCIGCFPAVFVQGDEIRSDAGWLAEDYCLPPVHAASCRYFSGPDQRVDEWPMLETLYDPVSVEAIHHGVLCAFETELTAELEIMPCKKSAMPPAVYLGETRAEALDTAHCYFFCSPDPLTHRCPRQALRYIFLPDCEPEDYSIRAFHRYVDIPVRASFQCDDDEMNRIFAVAAHTHALCIDVFFLDGIKRDKWIWAGDAYQSLFVNRYLTGDREIEQRTLTALRGNDPVTTHINTIVDYSLLWILGVAEHTDAYGDEAYLRFLWPKVESLMALLLAQRDEHGLRGADVPGRCAGRHDPLCAKRKSGVLPKNPGNPALSNRTVFLG